MNKLFYILVIIIVALVACDDFFEEDLTGKTVTLVAPYDGLQTSSSSFTFWWDEVEGASKYHFQIASPNFTAIEKIVADTNVAGNQFEAQLYPGEFQWRVKAYNGGSETPYTTHSLTVDSSLSLTDTEVILSLPGDNSAFNDTDIDFSWESIYNATEYNIKIRKDSWSSGDLIASDNIENANYSKEITDEGEYFWGVRAMNENSTSLYSSRSFFIDLTDPGLPTQISPTEGEEIIGNSVEFSWTRNTDDGSPISETILIDTTSTFTSSALIEVVGEDSPYPTSLSVSIGETKTYYWKIKSVDGAGNESNYTGAISFTLNNEK